MVGNYGRYLVGKLVGKFIFGPNPFWSLNGRDLVSNYRPIFSVGNLVSNLVIFSSASPLGHSIKVNRVSKNCFLVIHDREFSVDLIALPFHEFDLILGMDWLSKHQAIVDCDKKIVVLKCSDLSEVTIHGIRFGPVSNVIFAMQAQRFLRKGCKAFLALVLDSKRGQVNLEDIPVIKEFPDVFLEELSGLPPEREVYLAIEVLRGTIPISNRIAPTELKELKIQLHELLDKGFVSA